MVTPKRIQIRWSGWPIGAIPIGMSLAVLGYQTWGRVVLVSTRPWPLFGLECILFGVLGPAIIWRLMRQLARSESARDAANAQISPLQPQVQEDAARAQRRTQELTAFHAILTVMNQAADETDALSQALNEILTRLPLASGRIYLLNAQTGQWSLVVTQGDPSQFISDPKMEREQARMDADGCAPTPHPASRDRDATTAEALPDGDDSLSTAHDSDAIFDSWRQFHGPAYATISLYAQEQRVGVLQIACRRAEPFSDAELAWLRGLGALIGVAMENLRLREGARRAETLTALIQEMHHRIKNNLQTVADLLSLEMSASVSPEARHSLRDSISRIKSIAAVHQLLSLEYLRLSDITELARQVCDISLRQLTRLDHRVAAEVSGPPIYLPSKQATALALVMNELVANALEHAFADGQPGRLSVSLAQDGPQVIVIVADNGRGLPVDFDLERNAGLGLQIVRTLVEKDLAGALRLETDPAGGSRATLTFYR